MYLKVYRITELCLCAKEILQNLEALFMYCRVYRIKELCLCTVECTELKSSVYVLYSVQN